MSKRINWSFDGTLASLMIAGTGASAALSAANQSILNGDTRQTNNVNLGSSTEGYNSIKFNFPSAVIVDKILLGIATTKTFTVQVSSNSTDGYDGDWTEVLSSTGYSPAYANLEFAISPVSAVWLRLLFTTNGGAFEHVHLFGEYVTPRFEFYDSAGLVELSTNYPLLMANAPNFEDYEGSLGFRIKNTDTAAHTYSLVLQTVKHGGDSVISSNFTLSKDGGVTKNGSITLDAIEAGAMSGLIGVYGDVLIAANPADGYHWFVVNVQETS